MFLYRKVYSICKLDIKTLFPYSKAIFTCNLKDKYVFKTARSMPNSENCSFYTSLTNLLEKLNYLFARQWAWHRTFKINLICSGYTRTFMPNLISLAVMIAEICAFIRSPSASV